MIVVLIGMWLAINEYATTPCSKPKYFGEYLANTLSFFVINFCPSKLACNKFGCKFQYQKIGNLAMALLITSLAARRVDRRK